MFILHFRLFWAFKFFMKTYHFLGGFQVGTGEPPLAWELSQLFPFFLPSLAVIFLGGPITLWIDEILPPHLCSVCFITFMDSSKANLVLEKFDKKLGFGQTPPPPGWSKRPSFSVFFKAPFIVFVFGEWLRLLWVFGLVVCFWFGGSLKWFFYSPSKYRKLQLVKGP